MITYKTIDSMSLQNIQECPCGSIVVKLETKTGCTIVNERLNVSNIPCSHEATFLDCAEQVFLTCESAMAKNVPSEVIAKMKVLLQSRSLINVEYTKKWNDDHGMLVKATCTSGGTMSVGSLIVYANKKDFGNMSQDVFTKSASYLNWESVDKDIDAAYTLISTNVPLLHAEVETQDFKFSLEAIVIDNSQHVVNLCVLPHDSQVINFDNSRYKEILNRKFEKIDPSEYQIWSNFRKRKNMWKIHLQFCADMLLSDVKARTMIRTPVCTACVTRSDDNLCANVFIV
jgi:hypothetical protein